MEQMKNTPANRKTALHLPEEKKPKFYYSKRYNFLNRDDRKIVFKALLLIRMMEDRFEASQMFKTRI